MNKQKDHFHGSDLEEVEKIYGIRKETIVGFGANVNPLGISPKLRDFLSQNLEVITSYPDRDYIQLRNTIAAYCHADANHIMVGNGSTELISLFIQQILPKKALILGPTYSEYEREITLGGGDCIYFPLQEAEHFKLSSDSLIASLDRSFDLLVLCNPNNPTSSAITCADLEKIVIACQERSIHVMVDETYVEFTDDYENITAIPLASKYDNIVILRGISKFFAAPGLRLGYAVVGSSPLLSKMNTKKNPWTINSLAELAGRFLFTDTDYIEATKSLIHTERIRITNKLASIPNLKVYPPYANFVLLQITKEGITAEDMFDACIRKGFMIRDCSSFPYLSSQYFRFCFMKPSDNDALLDCIEQVLNNN